MERLIEFLKKYEDITEYKIVKVDKVSNQLYFVLQQLETTRVVDVTDITVTIYNVHNGKIGFANFSYSSTMDDEELAKQIEKSIAQAKLINNELFSLPTAENYKREIASNMRDIPLNQIATYVSSTIFACLKEAELSINSLEVFVNKTVRNIVTSAGIDKTETKFTGFYEAIPTFTKENLEDPTTSSVELFDEFYFGDFDKDQIEADVKQKLAEVKARYYAKKMEIEKVPVVIEGAELGQIFQSIVSEVNFGVIYNHRNILNVGDNIQPDSTGDKLNITLRGIIPSSPASRLFDEEGIDLIDTKIVENGVLINSYGTGRFAEYLKKTPTGNLPCIDVTNGTLTNEKLNSEKYLECISFSGIQVDLSSDYIGGEVRLANYFDGEKLIPVTGLSISGSLKNFLNDVKLSNEVELVVNYRGPKKAISKAFKII